MEKDLNYYLKLPWTYRFEWSNRDNCYIASVDELEGCKTHGETIEEAATMIKDALICWIETLQENNQEIQEPPKPEKYKGRVTYRTTPERHYRLARTAAINGKSISKLIDEAVDKEIA